MSTDPARDADGAASVHAALVHFGYQSRIESGFPDDPTKVIVRFWRKINGELIEFVCTTEAVLR